MKKTNNKGFSLVELIVVIAIMGVLMVVLAPQYLKYVEKSRLQKDNSALAEIANTIKNSLSDEAISATVGDGDTVATGATDNTFTFSGSDALTTELKSIVGDKVVLTSNTYKGKQVTFTINLANGFYTVTGSGIIETVGGTATTKVY